MVTVAQNKNTSTIADISNARTTLLTGNPWASAFSALRKVLGESLRLLAMAALAGALLAGVAKVVVPRQYTATVQVLIDPRGVNVKSGDLFSQLDANAAINFVESQMVVLKSDRVLARALADVMAPKIAAGAAPPATEQSESRAVAALQTALSVKRGDRSFVVNVTVANSDPQVASDLANAVVKAFMEIETIDRAGLAKRLKTEFDARLNGLQESVREASLAVETFRRNSGLFGANDQTALEWQLKQAIEALTGALVREDQAKVRLKMLEATPMTLGALGPLGDDATSRNLMAKLEALNKARAEEAALSGILGERHPQLQEVRATVAALTKDLDTLFSDLRKSATSNVERYSNEVAALRARTNELSDKLFKARAAEVEVRALQAELDGRKKFLDAFQSRYREVRGFGDIDESNVRLISPARPPIEVKRLTGVIAWGAAGAMMGLLLACAGLCLSGPLWLFLGAKPASR